MSASAKQSISHILPQPHTVLTLNVIIPRQICMKHHGLTQLSALPDLLHLQSQRLEPRPHRLHKEHVILFSSLDQKTEFSCIRRDGFLAENVLLGFDSVERIGVMQRMRCACVVMVLMMRVLIALTCVYAAVEISFVDVSITSKRSCSMSDRRNIEGTIHPFTSDRLQIADVRTLVKFENPKSRKPTDINGVYFLHREKNDNRFSKDLKAEVRTQREHDEWVKRTESVYTSSYDPYAWGLEISLSPNKASTKAWALITLREPTAVTLCITSWTSRLEMRDIARKCPIQDIREALKGRDKYISCFGVNEHILYVVRTRFS